MDPSWNELIASVLRPARPQLLRCRARAEAHQAAERRTAERVAAALADCRSRIERARATVFAAGDGVVKADMTALEREWRALARAERSPTERALALWNGIAPREWHGQPRWKSTGDLDADVQAAVALASDPEGVQRAERCAFRLASALSLWGFDVGNDVTWRVAPELPIDARAETLLEPARRAADDAIAPTYGGAALLARAHRLERDVLDAAAGSPLRVASEALRVDLAFVARVDFSWRACVVEGRRVPAGHDHAGRPFAELESPTAALVALWKTGYVLSAVDAHGVTLGALAP